MYSSTTLVGNLGQRPETKTLSSGSTVTRLSLATSRSWMAENGEKQEETQWHNVIAWGKLGENCSKYLDKGSKVLVEGRIAYRKVDSDGDVRYYTDIVANQIKFLDPAKRNDSRFPSEENPALVVVEARKQPTAAATEPMAAASDDLPF